MTLQQAISFHQQGKLSMALNAYQQLLINDQKNAQLLRLIGMIHWQQGQIDQAQEYLQQAMNIAPSDPILLSNWGMLWHHRGELLRAIEIYEQALQISPSTEVYCNLGTALSLQKRWLEACRAFRNAIALNEECWMAWWNLAAAHRENNEYSEAKDCLFFLEKRLGESAQLRNELGLLTFATQDWSKARAHFHQALILDPDSAEGYCNMALALREEGEVDVEQVFLYLEKSLALNPQYPNAYIHFALLLEQEGHLQGAISTLEYAAQHFPLNLEVQFQWALILSKEDLDRAIATLQALLKKESSRADMWLQLGHLHLEDQSEKEALKAFETCYQLAPMEKEAPYFVSIIRGQIPAQPPTEYLSRLFDGYAHSFERHLTKELAYQTPVQLMQMLDEHLEFPLRRIVDLGCGTGLMGSLLQDKCTCLIGIDISQKMIEQAEKKALYQLLKQVDIYEYLLEEEDVSLIVAADVFNYFGQLDGLFERAIRALEIGGYLGFSTELSADQEISLGITGRFCHSPEHIRTIASAVGFQGVCQQQAKLRKEKGEWVIGMLFLFKKV